MTDVSILETSRRNRRCGLTLLTALVGLVLCACAEAPQGQSTTALVGGYLIDGTGAAPVRNAVVLIQGERIVAAGPAADVDVPPDATVHYLSGHTVLPGLVEGSGHVVFAGQIDHARFFATRHTDYYQIGARNLYVGLLLGITSMRDTHGPVPEMFQLQRDERDGVIPGSRLFTAGAILNYPSLLDIPTERALSGADVAAARGKLDFYFEDAERGKEIIQTFAARGADFVKISLSGNSPGEPRPVALSEELLRELVEEAHLHGLKTTSHTMNVPHLRRAVEAGFDALEHPEFTLEAGLGVPIPDDLIQRIVDDGIYCIPLMIAMEIYIIHLQTPEMLQHPGYLRDLPADLVEEAREWVRTESEIPGALQARIDRYEAVKENLRRLIAAGAKIAMGTDKGTRLNFHQHANHVRELQTYVELGMTPIEAIESATRIGAELLGVETELGTVEAGKLADLLVVSGNPAAYITDIGNVHMVFKGGRRWR